MSVETSPAPTTTGASVTTVKVQTQLRGEIEVDERHIVQFVEPLVGFENLRHFLIYQTAAGPLSWLQSVDDPGVAFAVLAPFQAGLDPDYAIGPADLAELGTESAEDLAVYTMVVLSQGEGTTRTNLRAPILVCDRSALAKQIIFDDPDLPIQHPLGQLFPGQPRGR